MPYQQSYGTVINKPIGVVGKSTDSRSQYYDTTAFAFRDYVSTAEVLSWLSGANPTATAEVRKGHFPIYVTTGGVTTTYMFKDGTADGNLVPVATGTSNASDLTAGTLAPARIGDNSIPTSKLSGIGDTSNTILALGDSLTKGTGGVANSDYPDGTPWMAYFRNKTGYNFVNYGFPGYTSTQVLNDVYPTTSAIRSYPTVIWVGTNNLGQNSTILSDIAAMVAGLGHNRYLILNLPGHSSPSYWAGAGSYTVLQQLNAALVAAYGPRVVDVRAALVAAYNPADSQDVADFGHDIPPTSLMAAGDAVHFNPKGYEVIANAVAAKVQYLATSGTETKLFTTDTKTSLFNSPLGLGILLPNVGRFTQLAVAKNLVTEYYNDGVDGARQIVLDVNGPARFLHPSTTTQASGGLSVRARFPNEGGFANMEISGTNLNVWPSGAGLGFKNHTRDVTLGLDASPVELKLKGTLTASVSILTSDVTTSNATFTGVLSNTGSPRSGLSVDFSGAIGMGIPFFTQSQAIAVGGGGPFGTGVPQIGQIGLNITTNRLNVGWNKSDPYPGWSTVPFLEDIPVLLPGAGISIAQSGSNFTITNTTLPAQSKLTISASYANSEPNPTNGIAQAFDNNTTTFYQSATNDVDSAPHLGVTLTNQSVITKVRIYPADGIAMTGGKLQGSNTSTTTGFVDLFTLPTTAFYQWSEFNITDVNPYKYFRILGNPSQVALAAREVEVYGYQSAQLSVTPGGALLFNDTTKLLTLPLATNSVSGYLSAADRTAFAAKQNAITLSTTGSSGPATFNPSTGALNIPVYAGGAGGGGDVFLAGGNDFTGVNTFTTSATTPLSISGTGTSSYVSLNNTTASPNVGLHFKENNTIKWAIASYANKIAFHNAALGADAFSINGGSNVITFAGQLDAVGSMAPFNSGTITHHYGSASTYKNNANNANTLTINNGGTGIIQGMNAAGDVTLSFDSTNGAVTAGNGGIIVANNVGNTVNNVHLNGATGKGTFVGDVEMTTIGTGPIVKSPDGTRYRITVANGGALTTTVVA